MRSNPLIICKVLVPVFVFCALAAAPASAQTGGAAATPQKPQRPTVLYPNERRLHQQVLEGDRAIPLRLRYPEPVRTDMRAIQDLTLVAPGAQLAPLAALARLGPGPVAVQRARENLRQLGRVN